MNPDRSGGHGSTGSARRILDSPDLLVICCWWVLAAIVGLSRPDFLGDGLRHLPPILDGSGPKLGEPRWLLFPVFLFALLRPFVLTGLATSVETLAHIMMGATLLAGLAYMMGLRACLVAARIAPARRAAALAVAGASAGSFLVVSDLMEPLFGATLIVCALGWAARRTADPAATDVQRRRVFLWTVAAVALATLTYQGLVLGLGFLPLVIRTETLHERRAQWQALVILAFVPITMVAALMVAGNNLPHAIARAVFGAENPLYNTFLRRPGLGTRIVALIAGAPQGVATMGDFHGFNGLIADLKGGDRRGFALETLARFGVGLGVVAVGFIGAVRRRDVSLLIAFSAVVVLPVVRCQQYGYIKFYVLLPIVLAFGAAHARVPIAVAVAAVLLFCNAGYPLGNLAASRRLYHERIAVYERGDADTCWFTTGWQPWFNFRWTGKICPVLGSLANGHGANAEEVEADARSALTACLDACFCHSSSVFTDDATEPGGPAMVDLAQHFHYTAFDLRTLVLPVARAERLSPPGSIIPVYRYPASEQRRICGTLESGADKGH